jgi:hypothetical protein
MAKKHIEKPKLIGRGLCLFNIRNTAISRIYRIDGQLYAKPRALANNAREINGLKNLIPCKPIQIGIISAYQQIN